MSNKHPKSVGDELATMIKEWTRLAPATTIGGTTVVEFAATVKPSLDPRAKIESLDSQIKEQAQLRDAADPASHAEYKRIVKAIAGDKAFGMNSPLYRALGYVPDDERASGLHRSNGPAATKPPGTPVPPAS